jgi:hypothetical protein
MLDGIFNMLQVFFLSVEIFTTVLGNFNALIEGTDGKDGILDRGIVMALLEYQPAPEV